MVLGLLPSLAFAQRGRTVGGMGPTRDTDMPSTVGPMTSTCENQHQPGPATLGHGSVAPSYTPVGSTSTTVAPSTANSKTVDSVGTDQQTVPDRTIPPDTGTMRPDSGSAPIDKRYTADI